MSLAFLQLENVRCFEKAELELAPERNLIYGANGAGKTSLLEAIYVLGRGRSFRTRNTDRLIRIGQSQLTVFGRIQSPGELTLGIQVPRGGPPVAKISGNPVSSLTELTEVFPVQVIDPAVHRLIEDSAQRRRRWLDWAVFHVEQRFGATWTGYSRALRQRNAALRTQPTQARVWNRELSRLGEELTAARIRTLERLQPYWIAAASALAERELELSYSRGWTADRALADVLELDSRRDEARGLTHSGPHRADVQIRLGGRAARDSASRGQQKLIAVAMILAQLEMVQQQLSAPATLLLDDPGAELDARRLSAFIERVNALGCQLIITSLVPDAIAFGRPQKAFHVEHGGVESV